MTSNLFIQGLAFLITLLATDIIEGLFLENYGNGKIKFKLNPEKLNPFISKEKALLIWVVQVIVSGLVSIPLGKYFEGFVTLNIFYYFPLLCLSLIVLVALGARNLQIKMNRNLWKIVIISFVLFIISLILLTGGNIQNLKSVKFFN